jgi:hypothetical protein
VLVILHIMPKRLAKASITGTSFVRPSFRKTSSGALLCNSSNHVLRTRRRGGRATTAPVR